MRQIFSSRSGKISLGGILAAGSVALMLCSNLLPISRTGLVAIAGLFPMIGVVAAGHAVGYLSWFTAGILGLLLLPDKGNALLYLLFFGLYPVLKGQIEGIRKLLLEWILKFIYFNLTFLLCWFVFRHIFLTGSSPLNSISLPVLFLAGNVVFVCYDLLLSHVVALLRAGRKAA